MAKGPGVSGIALVMVVLGTVVGISGLRNADVLETLRALIKGQPLPSGPSDLAGAEESVGRRLSGIGIAAALEAAEPTASFGAAPSSPDGPEVVVATAKKYLGVPYKFGSSSTSGMDCSGFVNYVLGHDLGWPIPGSSTGKYSGHGPTAIQYYNFATYPKIARSQARSGDLVCYTGHIGIAVDNANMINAAHAGTNVRIQKIWGSPIFRRPGRGGS